MERMHIHSLQLGIYTSPSLDVPVMCLSIPLPIHYSDRQTKMTAKEFSAGYHEALWHLILDKDGNIGR